MCLSSNWIRAFFVVFFLDICLVTVFFLLFPSNLLFLLASVDKFCFLVLSHFFGPCLLILHSLHSFYIFFCFYDDFLLFFISFCYCFFCRCVPFQLLTVICRRDMWVMKLIGCVVIACSYLFVFWFELMWLEYRWKVGFHLVNGESHSLCVCLVASVELYECLQVFRVHGLHLCCSVGAENVNWYFASDQPFQAHAAWPCWVHVNMCSAALIRDEFHSGWHWV